MRCYLCGRSFRGPRKAEALKPVQQKSRGLLRRPQPPKGLLPLFASFSPFLLMRNLTAARGGRGITEAFIHKVNQRAAGKLAEEVFANEIRSCIGTSARSRT